MCPGLAGIAPPKTRELQAVDYEVIGQLEGAGLGPGFAALIGLMETARGFVAIDEIAGASKDSLAWIPGWQVVRSIWVSDHQMEKWSWSASGLGVPYASRAARLGLLIDNVVSEFRDSRRFRESTKCG